MPLFQSPMSLTVNPKFVLFSHFKIPHLVTYFQLPLTCSLFDGSNLSFAIINLKSISYTLSMYSSNVNGQLGLY